MNPRTGPLRRQHGVTIVEVLVAVVVLSLGMIGILGANTKGLSNVNSAGHRAQATWIAGQIIERARANTGGDYSIAFGATGGGSGQAATDLTSWKSLLGRSLPLGDGQIEQNVMVDGITGFRVRQFRVLVRWDDRRASGQSSSTGTSVPEYKHFLTETYLPAQQ
jgi:type IV pilus assembly protein PilV